MKTPAVRPAMSPGEAPGVRLMCRLFLKEHVDEYFSLKAKLKSKPCFPPPHLSEDGHPCPACFVTVICVCALTAISVLSFFSNSSSVSCVSSHPGIFERIGTLTELAASPLFFVLLFYFLSYILKTYSYVDIL